jgi:hypothetical protein
LRLSGEIAEKIQKGRTPGFMVILGAFPARSAGNRAIRYNEFLADGKPAKNSFRFYPLRVLVLAGLLPKFKARPDNPVFSFRPLASCGPGIRYFSGFIRSGV